MFSVQYILLPSQDIPLAIINNNLTILYSHILSLFRENRSEKLQFDRKNRKIAAGSMWCILWKISFMINYVYSQFQQEFERETIPRSAKLMTGMNNPHDVAHAVRPSTISPGTTRFRSDAKATEPSSKQWGYGVGRGMHHPHRFCFKEHICSFQLFLVRK